jgi:hypothetical protein
MLNNDTKRGFQTVIVTFCGRGYGEVAFYQLKD